jgi:glucose-6-phosphate dehydrogenase assembly protein OpcA
MTVNSIAPSAMSVPIDQAEGALFRAWIALGDPARTQTLNLVCVCSNEDEERYAIAAARDVLPAHPGRVLMVRLSQDPTDALVTVRTALLEDASRPGSYVGESLAFTVQGASKNHLASVVERVLIPGVPVVLWWLGDLPDNGSLFIPLADRADVVAVDSSQIDLSDLRTLFEYVNHRALSKQSISDIEWLRLRPWQESLARFFDDPAALEGLLRCDMLEVAMHTPSRGDFCSAKSALFAGWFAAQMKLQTPERPEWVHQGAVHSLTLRTEAGHPFVIRVRIEPREGLYDGAIIRIALSSTVGDRFELEREGATRVIAWRGNCAGAVLPEAVLRIGPPETPRMLRRLLDRPERDPLFLKALAKAAPWFHQQ